MRIALDAMGGDKAPAAPVEGALEAVRRYEDVEILLVGDPAVLERELANVNSELAKQAELVAAKQKEMVAVNAKYDADKKRWTELRAATAAMAAGEKDPASPLTPTTVRK